MVYLFWLVVLGVVAWAVKQWVPMEGNVAKIVTVAFVVVGLVLLWGLITAVVPALPAFPR